MGLLLRGHALLRLKRGEPEGRKTGLSLTAAGMPLVFSGYLVQVFTGEALRKGTGWIHAALGLLFALAFLMHGSRPPDDAPEAPSETQGHVP